MCGGFVLALGMALFLVLPRYAGRPLINRQQLEQS